MFKLSTLLISIVVAILANNTTSFNYHNDSSGELGNYAGIEIIDDVDIITDSTEYIHSAYGNQYQLIQENNLINDTENKLQSTYKTYKLQSLDGSVKSEGNCAITTLYSILTYYRDFKTTESLHNPILLSDDSDHLIYDTNQNEINYYTSVSNYIANHHLGYSIIRVHSDENNSYVILPQLYYELRNVCITSGYILGINYHSFRFNLMNFIDAEGYHFTNTYYEGDALNSSNLITDEIDDDRPVYLSVENDVVYNNHALMIKGYELYSNGTDEILMCKVQDNHNFALSAGIFVHNSKDSIDAICGALWNASLHAEEYAYEYGESLNVMAEFNDDIPDFKNDLQESMLNLYVEQNKIAEDNYIDFGYGKSEEYQFGVSDGLMIW